MGFFFNVLNGYLNVRFISHLGEYGSSWLTDSRFLVRVTVFVDAMSLNMNADKIRPGLLKSEKTQYVVSHSGAFRYVSCPNYLGEILEWTGWAIATWSLADLAFAVFTAANLAPRARSNHRWYREEFPDYPPTRRALIRGVF